MSAAGTTLSNDLDPANNLAAVMVPIAFDAVSYRTQPLAAAGLASLGGNAASSREGLVWWRRHRTYADEPVVRGR